MKGHWRHKLKVIHQARSLTAEEKQAGLWEGCCGVLGGKQSPAGMGWERGGKEQSWDKICRPPPNLFAKTLCVRGSSAGSPPGAGPLPSLSLYRGAAVLLLCRQQQSTLSIK